MGPVNWRGVLLGGLVAGLVINLVEAVAAVLTHDELAAILMEHGLAAPTSAGRLALGGLLGFSLGVASVWLYASIRPRYGAGPHTAALAGFMVWVLAAVTTISRVAGLGLLPTRLVVLGALIALVELVVATILGAWLYRERSAGP